MTTTNGKAETIEGLVASTNDRGFKLGGQDRYFNYSRFADVPHPERGQLVRVTFGADGFIRQLQVLGEGETSAPSSAAAAAAPDRLTLRLRALEIAASTVGAFAQCREQVKAGDVFPLADKMLVWLLKQPPRYTIEDLEP